MTDKNIILSRALTFLSEEEGLGKEIFNELVTLMDKEDEKGHGDDYPVTEYAKDEQIESS